MHPGSVNFCFGLKPEYNSLWGGTSDSTGVEISVAYIGGWIEGEKERRNRNSIANEHKSETAAPNK